MDFDSICLREGTAEGPSDVFAQPLVQALLKDGSEDVEMDVDMDTGASEASSVMWLEPTTAIALLQGIAAKYESMPDLFTKA